MELTYNPLTYETLTPRGMMKLGLVLMQVAAEAFKLVVPTEGNRATWQEFQNKVQTFDLFENVDAALQLQSGTEPLAELVGRSRALGSYSAVWATEGVGHYYAERCWEGGRTLKGLLRSDNTEALPLENLIPLHAGMGLSFACRLLGNVPRCPSCSLRKTLEEFNELCRDNAREGYEGAAYEALGLAARNLYPHLVPHLDHELMLMNEELAGYFWHGVGRALYFSPTNFLLIGSMPSRAMEAARHEPPHETGRLNALAGLVWALALVNIRHPQVLELFLKHHRSHIEENDAFASGLTSALVIWRNSARKDASIEKLYSHSPADPSLRKLWERQVRRSCLESLQRYKWELKEGNGLGRLFCYQRQNAPVFQYRAFT